MPEPTELATLRFLDRLDAEASSAKEEPSRHWGESLRQFNGDQWRIPNRAPYFLANIIRNQVERKVAALTETKPTIKVVPLRSDLEKSAHEITQAIKAIWDMNHMDMALTRLGTTGMVLGCGFVHTGFDPNAIHGLGDITVRPVDPRLIWIDPTVTSSEYLSDASYIIMETYDTLDNIKERFKGRGQLVKADPNASMYRDRGQESNTSGVVSAVLRKFPRVFRPGGSYREGPIQRATLREYWIRDPTLGADGQPLWFGGRHVIRAKDVILLDENNPYWDAQFPFDMIDWNSHLDHAWGRGEVYELRKIQEAFNRIGDGIIGNALISNNVRIIGDYDALEPDKWDELTNEPGIVIKKRPGRELSYEMPPSLPPYLFTLMTSLLQFADQITGNMDPTGNSRATGQVVSASAIEGLQNAQQLLVRSVARRFEALLERVGQKLISRVFQFYNADRMLSFLGPSQEWVNYSFQRQAIVQNDRGEFRTPEELERAFRDYRFLVVPGSSLASTRVQRTMLGLNLRGALMAPIPSIRSILKEADLGDPEELIREGLSEAQKLGLGGGDKPKKKK